jgi:hypothetical protein
MNVRDRLDLLPLRQRVSAAGDAAIVLARQGLLDWLAKPDKYRIVRHGDGGQILAVSEPALAEARAVLRQAYGSLVTFGIPMVHTYVDPQAETLMVPMMFLRIDAPRSHAQDLRRMLADRCAEIKEMDLQRQRVVVRAEVELARSLGLQGQVDEMTDGRAHMLAWLLRYQRASVPAPAVAPQRGFHLDGEALRP